MLQVGQILSKLDFNFSQQNSFGSAIAPITDIVSAIAIPKLVFSYGLLWSLFDLDTATSV
jgi:hypothetical protein